MVGQVALGSKLEPAKLGSVRSVWHRHSFQSRSAGSVEFVRVNLSAYDAQLGINDVRYLLFAEQIRAHPEWDVIFTVRADKPWLGLRSGFIRVPSTGVLLGCHSDDLDSDDGDWRSKRCIGCWEPFQRRSSYSVPSRRARSTGPHRAGGHRRRAGAAQPLPPRGAARALPRLRGLRSPRRCLLGAFGMCTQDELQEGSS